MATLTVDARLHGASGIGTYLAALLPRVVARRSEDRFRLIGDPARLAEMSAATRGRVEIAPCRLPIYTVREQVALMRLRAPRGDLFWSPHYNVPLLHRGPQLVTVHDVLHLARPEFVPGPHARLYARGMFARIRRSRALVVAVSRFTADELVVHAGIPRERVRVVHQGVDPAWAEPAADDRPHSRPYLLYVGNVKLHKNLGTLLAALDLLGTGIGVELVIVGRGSGLRMLDREARRRAEERGSRVHFTGHLTDPEVRRFVRHATALVHPALYEGFGLTPLEAMAAGCPTVVARAASLPEVCGEAALYFDPTDPVELAGVLRRLLRSPELAAELRERGRERARGFSWDRCAAETSEVMDAAMDR